MNTTTDSNWDYVPTPVGPRQVPGFAEWRELTDEELCARMNAVRFVDPAGLAVAMARPSVCNFYNGRAYVWDTLANYGRWRDQQPTGFERIIAMLSAER